MKKIYILFMLLLPLILFAQRNPNEWTIVATYEIPGKAGGITYDGSWLYSGLYSSSDEDNRIFKIDPSDGTYELQCYAPIEEALGLSFDGTHFWSTDRQGSYDPALAVQFDMDGNFMSNFELPATYFSGIEYMEDGTFWATCYYDPNGTAFHLDNNGNELDQFTTPNTQPWAICQMDDKFWIADYDADMIYLVDETGQVLESHESIDVSPTGVVFDGTYLWYVAGPVQNNSILYKVDLGGGGNPVLDIQPNSVNLADHLVGETDSFNLSFSNEGGTTGVFISQGLSGTGLGILNFENLADEIEIAPGSSQEISFDVSFDAPGIFDLILKYTTNDPVNNVIEIPIFGQITNDGAVLETNMSTIDYNDIRLFANTRRFIQLINTGNEILEIEDITFTQSGFIIFESIQFPQSIAPLDTFELGVWFHPQSTGNFDDQMMLFSNDPNSPLSVSINANAIETNNNMGQLLWNYQVTEGYDQSPKAMLNIDDINGDGVGDVVACIENNHVMCFNGNSDGTADLLWSREIYSGNVYQQNAIDRIDDIDQDEYIDFIVGTTGVDKSIVCISSKTGVVIWKFYTNAVGDGGWVYQVYGQKDFNGDGINDALAAVGDDIFDTGPKGIFLIDGETGDEIWYAPLGGPAFSVIGVEDFTGDGLFDVLAGASNGDETQGKIYGIDGSDGSIEWNVNANGSSVWALTRLGDINGDDISDVVAGDFSGYYYFLDATNGNELGSGVIGNNLIVRLLDLGDVSNDGFNDILIANSSTNIYLIDGYSADALWSANLDDKAWNVAVANDLNQDGINDVMAGTLYQSNYSYFLDGASGDEMSKKAANTAIDALCSIDDICRDWTMEMVVGDRNGLISCYSGGIHSNVGIVSEKIQPSNNFKVYPNPSSGQVQIDFDWNKDEIVQIKLVSTLLDTPISLKSHQAKLGANSIVININTAWTFIKPGLYLITISGTSEKLNQKLILIE